jgi:hypothetical protein
MLKISLALALTCSQAYAFDVACTTNQTVIDAKGGGLAAYNTSLTEPHFQISSRDKTVTVVENPGDESHRAVHTASVVFGSFAPRVLGWKIEEKNLKSYYSHETVTKILSVTKIVENDFTATSVFICK